MYNSYAIVPMIALFCYIFLLLSLLAAKKEDSITAFMEMLLLMVAWTAGSWLMRSRVWPNENFWFQVSLFGLMLFPVSLFHFLKTFLEEPSWYRIPFWLCVILLLCVINAGTGILIDAPRYVEDGNGGGFVYNIDWKIAFLLLAAMGAIGESGRLIWNHYRKNVFLPHQLLPVGIGVLLLFLGNLGVILPVFEGFPIDLCAGIPMAVCFYYALQRRQMFHMKLQTSRISCYLVAFVLVIGIFYRWMPKYETWLKQNLHLNNDQNIVLITFTMVACVFGACELIRYLFDLIFEADEALYSLKLKEFSEKISKLMTMDEILETLIDTVKDTLETGAVFIFVPEEGGFRQWRAKSDLRTGQFVIPEFAKLAEYLESCEGRLLLRELPAASWKSLPGELRTYLETKRIQCIIASKNREGYDGLLMLGARMKEKKYHGEELYFLSSILSMALMVVANSRLYDEAYWENRHDSLTGAGNRKYLYEYLQKCFEEHLCEQVALLLVSVDDFKLYNQLYGAEEGDLALQRIVGIIAGVTGKLHHIFRFEGKEFMVPFFDCGRECVEKKAKEISRQVRELNRGSGEYAMKALTVSCGIALGQNGQIGYHELIRQSEMAVYYAKKAGKNRIEVYTEGVHTREHDAGTEGEPMKQYAEIVPTIYALTAAIDAKDHYTFSHSENVAYYARELARAYGLNQGALDIVYMAGLLHDIGKIGIDEQILNKPGKLTDGERRIMQTHVELSIGIIRHLHTLDYMIPAVLGHHERYDGAGYPRGIKGEEIPLLARILCVADSFDAMVSERAYKQKMEVSRALEILEEEAGKQFDPRLTPVFIEIVKNGTLQVRS